jgi:hypothetical protein
MAFATRERSKPDKEEQDAERNRLEAALELEGTFPASDAVAVTQPAPERYIGPTN